MATPGSQTPHVVSRCLLKTWWEVGWWEGRVIHNAINSLWISVFEPFDLQHRRRRLTIGARSQHAAEEHMTRTIIAAALALSLAGCATTGEQQWNDLQREAMASRADRIAQIANTADCNGDPTCVVAAKGFAALAEAGNSGGEIRQYVQQPSTAARIGLALIGQISPLASAAVAWRSSDNAARTAEAQFGFLGGVVSDVTASTARTAEAAFGVLPALAPSINVGRDYVTGQVGDTVGRDQIGGDYRVGDNIARDTIGGDRTDTRTDYGAGNRINSPGPYRDVGNDGARCTGVGCQTVNPPPAEPDE